MSGDYWTTFWKRHGIQSAGENPQSRILRTLNQQPISPEAWDSTLTYIRELLQLTPNDRVLDLCGGNGLVAAGIAPHCRDVVVVDISTDLLESAVDSQAGNITRVTADMRSIEFGDASFDRVLCYAGLQYLTPDETVALFGRVHNWLTANGVFVVGDIPDVERQWEFFNTRERQSAYFDGLLAGEPIVGTWFQKQWLAKLADHSGFHSTELLDQPHDQIYSWFRFDFRSRK